MYTIPHSFHYRKKQIGWQVILSYKSGGSWKQKAKQGFLQKSQAKAAGEELLRDIQKNYVPSSDAVPPDILLKHFYTLFLQDKGKSLSNGTIVVYENALNAFPELSVMPLRQITNKEIQRAINESTLNSSTVKLYMGKFKALFNHAKDFYGLIARIPFQNITYPNERKKKKIKTISKQEFVKMYEQLCNKNYMYAVMAAIGYYAGLRYGEITGLTWGAIDLENSCLHITQQFKRFRTPSKKYIYKLGSLKTKNSQRMVPIPLVLKRILLEYKRNHPQITRDGRIFDLQTSESNMLNSYIKQCIPDISIHTLRHTYATTLLAKGVDIKTVAALLGDTVETAIKKYIHYNDTMRKQAAASIQKIFQL